MTDRARILGLMAIKERAAVAAILSQVGALARALADSQTMADRLRHMVAQRSQSAGDLRLGSDIRADRHLTAQLLTEADRQRDKTADLAARLAAAQTDLAAREYRLQTLDEKVAAARHDAREERQSRADAAMPPRVIRR